MSRAVSYSRMSLYRKCPASYEWQYVLGHKEPFAPGSAAARGTRIHNSIENFYNGTGDMDEEMRMDHVERLNHHYLAECESFPEYEFAFNKEWEPCGFDDEEAFIRGYIDNMHVYPDKVVIDEYKTGQEYPEHEGQKLLYGMIALILYPNIDFALVEGIYLDKPVTSGIKPVMVHRTFLKKMQGVWERDIAKLDLPLYPARPGGHCRWCPKSSKKEGGTCQLG